MTVQLEISTQGRLGVIVLSRPEAINALSREMIDGITGALAAWRDDPSVTAVLFEGNGPRGFCSGGDVRAARSAVLAGRADEADAYFAAEYAMNLVIATYDKPVVAFGHGAVMGGGIGIAGHARYRFTLPEARFAMPESAIGFVCDIGVNAILAQAPEHRALAFLLSGLPVGPGDALVLGLTDARIEAGRLNDVRVGVAAAAASSDPDAALVRLMQAESSEPGAATFCPDADELADAFGGDTAGDIVAAVAEAAAVDPRFERLATALSSRSPASLETILQGHRAARRRPDIAAVLDLDLRLARYVSRQPDFAEGVRAVLVDKDQRPSWRPNTFEAVDRTGIAQVVAAAD